MLLAEGVREGVPGRGLPEAGGHGRAGGDEVLARGVGGARVGDGGGGRRGVEARGGDALAPQGREGVLVGEDEVVEGVPNLEETVVRDELRVALLAVGRVDLVAPGVVAVGRDGEGVGEVLVGRGGVVRGRGADVVEEVDAGREDVALEAWAGKARDVPNFLRPRLSIVFRSIWLMFGRAIISRGDPNSVPCLFSRESLRVR